MEEAQIFYITDYLQKKSFIYKPVACVVDVETVGSAGARWGKEGGRDARKGGGGE